MAWWCSSKRTYQPKRCDGCDYSECFKEDESYSQTFSLTLYYPLTLPPNVPFIALYPIIAHF